MLPFLLGLISILGLIQGIYDVLIFLLFYFNYYFLLCRIFKLVSGLLVSTICLISLYLSLLTVLLSTFPHRLAFMGYLEKFPCLS